MAPGAALNYTIKIHDPGPNDAINATLLDKVPSGTTFLAIDQGPDGNRSPAPAGRRVQSHIRCTRGILARRWDQGFFVAVKVNNPFNGTINYDAATIGSDQTVQVDTDLSDNSASTETTVNPPNGGSTVIPATAVTTAMAAPVSAPRPTGRASTQSAAHLAGYPGHPRQRPVQLEYDAHQRQCRPARASAGLRQR